MTFRLPNLLVAFLLFGKAYSATYYTRVSGNWNTASTWSTSSCSGAAASTIPGAADNVVICAGKTLTMNGNPANCLSLTVNGTANWSSSFTINIGSGGLILNNGAALTSSGAGTGIINVAGLCTLPAGASATLGGNTLNANGGMVISGTLTCNNTGGTKTFASLTLNSGATFSSTVAETYAITGNLTSTAGSISGGSNSVFNVGGSFIINAGSTTFDAGSLNVTGTTSVSGTLVWGGTTGTKTLGDVTVNTGGTWNNAINETFGISGNIVNNGTFSSGTTASTTLTGSGKTISGSSATTFGWLTVDGTITNNGVVTVNRRFQGSGTFTQGVNSTLNIVVRPARFTITGFAASATGNTVNYSRAGGGVAGAQTIRAATGGYYHLILSGTSTKTLAAATTIAGNLTISSGVSLDPSNLNMNVGGNFINNGTYINGTETVAMNGAVAQFIGGTTATTFQNLAINNTAAVVSTAVNITVNGNLTVNSGGIFSPGASNLVSGTGNLTGSGTARVTRIATTPDFISQYTITTKTLSGLNIDYFGAGNQNVNILNYGSLTISTNGTRTVTFPAAVVGVSNVFSPTATSTTYVIAGNTINFKGTISQTIPAFNYYNLTSSSSGARNLSSIGTIGVAAVFTPGTNLYTIAGSTVDFNGSISQTIPSFKYYNLKSSSTGTRTLPSVGTVYVAAAFTPGTNTYTITNSTVNFNGTIAQTIPAFTFYNLVSSGTGTISLGGNVLVQNDLNISSNLDVSTSSYNIDLKHNWVNNGTFVPRTGTVTFSGSSAQTLSGAGLTSFNNLAISNTAGGVSLVSGSYQILAALLPNSGNFNANGKTITLVSTATQTARIGQKGSTASISGNFIVQRYLSSRLQSPTVGHWSDLASPVQSSTMADWDNELFLSYPHSPPTVYSNVLAYSESLDDYVGVSASTLLTPGKGFEISLTDDGTLTTFSNTTLNTIGVPSQGTQNLSGNISFAGAGSNLVGNPFASSISWNTVLANSSGILNTYDEFDCNAGTYATFGTGSEIGAGQGFWVYTTSASATLIVPEAAKTTSSNSVIRSMDHPMLNLQLQFNNDQLPYSHTLKIGQQADAANGWDPLDHPFRKSPIHEAPSITCFADSKEVSWNMLSNVNNSFDLPLITRVGISGEYTLKVSGLEAFSDYSCLMLEDKRTGKWIDLNKQQEWTMTMNVADNAQRLVLHFNKSGDCSEMKTATTAPQLQDQLSFVPNSNGITVHYSLTELSDLLVQVTDVLGRLLIPQQHIRVQEGSSDFTLPTDFSGVYLIKLSGANGACVYKGIRE